MYLKIQDCKNSEYNYLIGFGVSRFQGARISLKIYFKRTQSPKLRVN